MEEALLKSFLNGKTETTLALFHHFVKEYKKLGNVELYPTKSMIGIICNDKKVAWVTQLGKNFVHIVLPFKQAYSNNLCFIKIAQVPGSNQYNHHLRLFLPEDINDEVKNFMKLALD